MIKTIFFSFAALLLLMSVNVPEKVWKKAEKEITKFYEIPDFDRINISITKEDDSKTLSSFSSDNFFKINHKGKTLGYAYIGNAPSKTATFDYIVIFDTAWIISKSKVLIYREEYGGEIGSRRWLKQFEGSSSVTPELQYVKDIIPISGATISAQSMTKAINNLLQSIKYLKSSNTI